MPGRSGSRCCNPHDDARFGTDKGGGPGRHVPIVFGADTGSLAHIALCDRLCDVRY